MSAKFVFSLIAVVTLNASPASGRTFTDRTGRKLEAEIVAKQGDQIRVRRADGQEFTLAAASLSPADQEYVKTWLPATAPASAADPRATPGAIVALEFPALPTDKTGAPAVCNVRLPDDYDPAKPVPLLVWIGGGQGSNQPGGGFPLVDKAHWAIAALPYPSTAPPPALALDNEKDLDAILGYHKTMLAEVLKLLPNLDPKLRIVAGFSNGAHTIGTYIARGENEFVELFHAFVIIEGGGNFGKAKKKLRDKFAYLAWGNDASKKGSKEYMAYIRDGVKDARLETTTHEMDGVGHAFPDAEKALVKEWIEKTVVPSLSGPPKL